MTLDLLEKLICQWADERGLLKPGCDLRSPEVTGQFIKTVEELGEMAAALARDNRPKLEDAIGDVFVTLVIGAYNADIDLRAAIENVLREIQGRSGRTVGGIFIKEPGIGDDSEDTDQ